MAEDCFMDGVECAKHQAQHREHMRTRWGLSMASVGPTASPEGVAQGRLAGRGLGGRAQGLGEWGCLWEVRGLGMRGRGPRGQWSHGSGGGGPGVQGPNGLGAPQRTQGSEGQGGLEDPGFQEGSKSPRDTGVRLRTAPMELVVCCSSCSCTWLAIRTGETQDG